MLSVLIEPESLFAKRQSQGAAPAPCQKPADAGQSVPRRRGDDFQTLRIMNVVADYGPEPMPIISLAAQVVRQTYNHGEERVKMVEMLKLTGVLIRRGRLQRVGRRYVALPAAGMHVKHRPA